MKIKAPKEIAETVEVLDAITPEIPKGRGALKLLFLLPVAAGAAAVFAKRRLSRDKGTTTDHK